MLNLKKVILENLKRQEMKIFAYFENYTKRHPIVFHIFSLEDSIFEKLKGRYSWSAVQLSKKIGFFPKPLKKIL